MGFYRGIDYKSMKPTTNKIEGFEGGILHPSLDIKGGVLILGSPIEVTTTGTLSARGGDGGPSAAGSGTADISSGMGGGGGGGIVHLLAPRVTRGRAVVRGGNPGWFNGVASEAVRTGGGGGGGSASYGGDGATVRESGEMYPAEPGAGGWALVTEADPSAAF